MPGRAAVVLTAAALSVTVGVLVGIVLVIGDRARQPSASLSSNGAAVSTVELDPALVSSVLVNTVLVNTVLVSSAPASTAPLSSAPLNSAPLSTAPSSTAPPGSAPPSPAPLSTAPPSTGPGSTGPPSMGLGSTGPAGSIMLSPTSSAPRLIPHLAAPTRPAIVRTTVTVAAPTSSSTGSPTASPTSSSAGPTTTSSPVPSRATATTAAPTAPAGGTPAAGRPCASLGDESAAADGSTVFCQRDFSHHSLAWRAVVDGGGCLSKKMTGTGTDGKRYVCRPDRNGLDHWRRA